MTIQEFAEIIHQQQIHRIKQDYPALNAELEAQISIHPGRKYTRVDVGSSGKYMVDQAGNIYGIKAYGVPHLGHKYGTLETVDQYSWGGYTAVRK